MDEVGGYLGASSWSLEFRVSADDPRLRLRLVDYPPPRCDLRLRHRHARRSRCIQQ